MKAVLLRWCLDVLMFGCAQSAVARSSTISYPFIWNGYYNKHKTENYRVLSKIKYFLSIQIYIFWRSTQIPRQPWLRYLQSTYLIVGCLKFQNQTYSQLHGMETFVWRWHSSNNLCLLCLNKVKKLLIVFKVHHCPMNTLGVVLLKAHHNKLSTRFQNAHTLL